MALTRLRRSYPVMFALCLLGALARAEPAAAFSFFINVQPLPICVPTKGGQFCSLVIHANNGFPAIPAPLAVRLRVSVTPAFKAAVAVGAQWACAINPAGTLVNCVYIGPKPIAPGFAFPSITIRARAKPTASPIFVPVCATIQVFAGAVPQQFPGQTCTNVQIVP